jgi:hypothetical protein
MATPSTLSQPEPETPMSNHPSVIARPTPTGFEGRYIHNDGHPDIRIPLLGHLYRDGFGSDLTAMTAFLIDAHPAGWSQLGPDPRDVTDWFGRNGRLDPWDNRFVCYCHGDRNDEPQLYTEQNATLGTLAEWIYILTTDGIRTLALDEDSYDEKNDPCGDRMTRKAPILTAWDFTTASDAEQAVIA